jgi:hypothetical protein
MLAYAASVAELEFAVLSIIRQPWLAFSFILPSFPPSLQLLHVVHVHLMCKCMQVPSSLVVCYQSGDRQMVEFKRLYKWSSSIYLGSKAVDIQWKLLKAGSGANSKTFSELSHGTSTYSAKNKAVIEGLNTVVHETGTYCLQVTSACPWVTTQLEYNFKVKPGMALQRLCVCKAWLPDSSAACRNWSLCLAAM